MTARMYRLTELHQKINARLRLEQRRRLPDSLELSRLKRLKLRIKDKIHRLLARKTVTT